jgi:NAD(P)-dependent dehydrogenase (short-subunit alcohol dehydrogenase family)
MRSPFKPTLPKKADVERLFAGATKAFGKIDILVNNAGVYEFAPLDEITEQQFFSFPTSKPSLHSFHP